MTTKSTIPAGRRPAPGTQAPSSGIAAELARVFGDICGLPLPLPVRLRAWDDSLAGPSDGPEVVLRSPAALRRLIWHPNELGLAQAYVTGELDVTGDLADGLRRVWRVLGEDGCGGRGGRGSRPQPVRALRPRTLYQARRLGVLGRRPALPASQAALTGRRHTKGRDQAAIAFHYDLSNDFYRLILDESMAQKREAAEKVRASQAVHLAELALYAAEARQIPVAEAVPRAKALLAGQPFPLALQALIAVLSGDPQTALPPARKARRQPGSRVDLADIYCTLAHVHGVLGDRATAGEFLDRARGLAPAYARPGHVARRLDSADPQVVAAG